MDHLPQIILKRRFAFGQCLVYNHCSNRKSFVILISQSDGAINLCKKLVLEAEQGA